jgi:hypothetical protein
MSSKLGFVHAPLFMGYFRFAAIETRRKPVRVIQAEIACQHTAALRRSHLKTATRPAMDKLASRVLV